MSFLALSSWFGREIASLPPGMLLFLYVLALIFSTPGFYRVVYFISIGYAFSIVAMAVAVMIVMRQNLTGASLLHNLLLMVWGLRLGLYLVRREMKPSYGNELAVTHQRTAGMSLGLKVVIWVGVSFLYVLMFLPSLVSVMAAPAASAASPLTGLIQWIGLAIMAGALAMETVADNQKSAFKARFPKQFCNTGLYRWSRCPNYLGEILFWVGNWVAGLVFYGSILIWVASFAGLVCIVLIMLGSTKRLESQQNERYGNQPEYQAYARSVPILFPLVPVYTFENLRVYLG